jgi:hypothetical protein
MTSLIAPNARGDPIDGMQRGFLATKDSLAHVSRLNVSNLSTWRRYIMYRLPYANNNLIDYGTSRLAGFLIGMNLNVREKIQGCRFFHSHGRHRVVGLRMSLKILCSCFRFQISSAGRPNLTVCLSYICHSGIVQLLNKLTTLTLKFGDETPLLMHHASTHRDDQNYDHSMCDIIAIPI